MRAAALALALLALAAQAGAGYSVDPGASLDPPTLRVSPRVRALVVPGSERVRRAAEREGLHEVFQEAGFEWRGAGCSMCLAMNPDRLQGREICASSSNRNFKGRQGSPTGRTLLMSPAMVAAAALAGEVVDVRRIAAPAEVTA